MYLTPEFRIFTSLVQNLISKPPHISRITQLFVMMMLIVPILEIKEKHLQENSVLLEGTEEMVFMNTA